MGRSNAHVYACSTGLTSRCRQLGKSDQNVINNVITEFLHNPYRSVEEPLDVLFLRSGGAGPIEPCTVGISIGSAKSVAALTILHVILSNEFTDEEIGNIAQELGAMCVVRATTDPAADLFDQIRRTLGKKIRASERARPNPLQLEFAFTRVLDQKVAAGDKRPRSTIMVNIIKDYNGSQTGRSKLSPEERAAVQMLGDQQPGFKQLLKEHWRNYLVAHSAVPVSYLSCTWLGSGYEPAAKKSTPDKNVEWLRAAIGRYQHRWKEMMASGKAVKLAGAAGSLRTSVETETFYHCVGLYLHFRSAIQQCCGVLAYSEVDAKFYRGALERELTEKVKSRDPSLSLDDFRFVQAAKVFDPTAAGTSKPTTEAMHTTNLESNLKLDAMVLKNEQEIWAEHCRAQRAFSATTHYAKVQHMEAP